jgi:NTP pyrophosphatase (non-canonical NTP hydrolase)
MAYKFADPDVLMETGERDLREQMAINNFAASLTLGASLCHTRNLKWWQNPATKEPIDRNVGELLMLCVSELAEGMEAHRKGLNDDKIKHRPGLEVELVDCIIRIMDLAGALNLDIAGAFIDKMEFNRVREDHTHEARLKAGGKAY